MSKQFVAKTKNGFDVYVDIETSHAATHLKNHAHLFDLMKEVILNYEVIQDTIRFETDMSKKIGTADLVETNETDDVFYAKRPNRDKYTRFVNNREPELTSYITIELRKTNDTEYEVFTVFIGRITPSFPLGIDDTNEVNREFWKTHALATGTQDFIPETITTECPW
jgi:hypothetical protein